MEKIRINDLARELEVKAKLILDFLPTLGVTDKKTHSSSVDDDTAEIIRRRFQNGGGETAREAPAVEPPPVKATTAASALEPAKAAAHLGGAAPLKAPLRTSAPPLMPPLAHVPSAPPGVTLPRAEAAPPAAAAPAVPPPAVAPSVKPIPVAPPVGQTATGPRAPMPAAGPATGVPLRPHLPGARPPVTAGQLPAAPMRPLAGQPPPRPRVPPQPGLADRLARPGMPVRKPLAPLTPGKPIFDRAGRARPGQPAPGAMAARGAGVPSRPGARPMHPTSRMGRPGVVPSPTTEPARRQHRPARPRTARDREAEREAKLLRRSPAARAQAAEESLPITREITVIEGITVKELAEKLDVTASAVIKKLVAKGVFATINQTLDARTGEELARLFGASTATISYEEASQQQVQQAEDVKDVGSRAPVVTIMGHVDHGKTSLLDAIRETNVAAREAGGITQAIGAYQVRHKGREIVFIDTPGHEAFTRMRARGAKITDLVILVVAADDGVMPQTLEAIDHARAAKVPILVAINKIDKPNAQPERVKQQLADRGLLAEDWGGDTVTVPVSAKARTNLDLLLEMVLLIADMQDLKANASRPGMGTVIEAKLDRGQGPVATVLVQNGTLRVGDFFIVGAVFGKVRAMLDDIGQPVREAPPSTPVVVLGLEDLPDPGDSLQVVTDTSKARQIAGYREAKARESSLARSARMTLETLHEQMRTGDVKELSIILKADVTGSIEVLGDTLQKLSTDKVKLSILHRGVGAISESDVLLAAASNAIIVGFSVRPERTAAEVAQREKVDIRLHTVIYDVTDEIKRAMAGLLEPVFKETFQGKAEVRETFRIPKVGAVAGCMVQDGRLTRESEVRLLRDNVVVYTGKVSSLRRFKDDVSEVRNGFECGVTLSNFADIKKGDVIEAFLTEKVAS